MSDGMYVGMSAMSSRERELEAIADNLANADTPGFKANMYAFETFFPDGAEGNMASVAAVDAGLDHRTGLIRQTGNPLDVIPAGENYFQVEMENGEIGFTRNGQITIQADGTLAIGGKPVLNEGSAPIIVPPDAPVKISADGTVWSGNVRMERISASVVRAKNGNFEPSDNRVRVGEIELSNISALEASVDMMQTQRLFDNAVQAVQTYRKLDDRAIQVGKV